MSWTLGLLFLPLLLAEIHTGPPTFVIGNARFTFHSESFFRMEWSGAEVASFEDRPSLVVVDRSRTAGHLVHRTELPGGDVELRTNTLSVRFSPNCAKRVGGLHAPDCLRVSLGGGVHWSPPGKNGSLVGSGNLRGSLQTMDCYVGPDACRLAYENRTQPGLVSRDGWSVLDESTTPLWNVSSLEMYAAPTDPLGDGAWRVERSSRHGWTSSDTDWFFFGHGHNYRDALRDFVGVAGQVPLMPLSAYGVWWSRYWTYDERGITDVIDGYALRQLPLHMVVLDMDWHIETPDPGGEPAGSPLYNCNQGWGGYVWNRSLFSDPVAFQRRVHDRGLQLVINTHDQCGVQATQGEVYHSIVKDLGLGPSFNKTVACHLQDRRYADALWTHAMRSQENTDVDFWWTDLCDLGTPGAGAGNQSNYRCIADDLTAAALWSNILHAEGASRGGSRRGLVLTVDGGLGNHRYPQVGSGDTFANWTTLDFQVYQTATAANVAVAWTHDLGGFMVDDGSGGRDTPQNREIRDPEMFLRWLQFGALSPLFRTHCSHCEIRPWMYPNFEQLAPWYRFRSAMVPYVYTAAAGAHRTGVLAAHPVYYDYPSQQDAYTFKGQYLFGPSLLVAPVTTPSVNGTASKDIWVPPGTWIEWSSAMKFEGGINGTRLMARPYRTTELPFFVMAGAVIPQRRQDASGPWPNPLLLQIVHGDRASAVESEVYDDAGDGLAYSTGAYRVTKLMHTVAEDGASAWLDIMPRFSGHGHDGELSARSYEVYFRCGKAASSETKLPAVISLNGTVLPRWPHEHNSTTNGWWTDLEPETQVQRAVVRVHGLAQSNTWRLHATFSRNAEVYHI